MAKAKPETKLLATPAGIAIWPKLNKPDTKFNAAGVFETKLRLPQEEGAKLQAKLEEMYEAFYLSEQKRVQEEKKAKALPKLKRNTDLPWKAAVDEDGAETGEIEFKFKRQATGVSKKTGKTWTAKVFLLDAKRQPSTAEVWSGSTIKVSFEPYCWNTALGVGITLKPHTVQIIKLVTKGEGGQAATDMFADEEGYEETAEDTTETTDAPASDQEGADSAVDETDPTNF